MDNRPIGVFDSGVGGLTTVKELHKILPGENIVYFGDTGRVPYGTRSRQTIQKYAAQAIHFLTSFDVKAIIAACNTVSANLPEKDAADLCGELPYIGAVLPAARSACAISQGGKIGVIATPASIRSGAYNKAVRSIRPSAQVFGNAGPLLVPLVENGLTDIDNQITRLAVRMYLEPLLREKVDTLILGCTHYPIICDIINDEMNYTAAIIDSGAAAAREAQALLCQLDLLSEQEKGRTAYYVTDSVENFAAVAKNFLFEEIEKDSRFVDISQIEISETN